MLEKKMTSTGAKMINKLLGNISAGRTTLLAFAGILLLGGCETTGKNFEDWSAVPERRAPVASRVLFNHQVLFGAQGSALADGEQTRLAIFLDNTQVSPSDRIFLNAGGSPLSRLRAQSVAEFLVARKVRVEAMPASSRAGASAQAVGVVVSRYVVTLPGCPDWTGQRQTYNNVPTSNWGCATAINLGRMVARPEDLVRGRNPGAFDGEYGTRSIDLYRKGETKSLTRESVGPIENQQNSSSGSGE